MKKTFLFIVLWIFVLTLWIVSHGSSALALTIQKQCAGQCNPEEELYCGVCTGVLSNDKTSGKMEVYICKFAPPGAGWHWFQATTDEYNKPRNPTEFNVACAPYKISSITGAGNCRDIQVKGYYVPNNVYSNTIYDSEDLTSKLQISFSVNKAYENHTFNITHHTENGNSYTFPQDYVNKTHYLNKRDGVTTLEIDRNMPNAYTPVFEKGDHQITVKREGNPFNNDTFCKFSYTVLHKPYQYFPQYAFNKCSLTVSSELDLDSNMFTPKTPIIVIGRDIPYKLNLNKVDSESDLSNKKAIYGLKVINSINSSESFLDIKNNDAFILESTGVKDNLGSFEVESSQTFDEGTYTIKLGYRDSDNSFQPTDCTGTFTINESGGNSQPTALTAPEIRKICDNVPQDKYTDCSNCVTGVTYDGTVGAYTALGCLPTDPVKFLSEYILVTGLGLAGVIGFLLMLWGAFNIIISQGDPQKISQGREIIVSAGVGLLLIIFSIVILRFIGVDILHIPGFG